MVEAAESDLDGQVTMVNILYGLAIIAGGAVVVSFFVGGGSGDDEPATSVGIGPGSLVLRRTF